MPRVIAKINPTGGKGGGLAIDLDGQEFQGTQCDNVMDRLARALGGDPEKAHTEHKPEYAMEGQQATELQ